MQKRTTPAIQIDDTVRLVSGGPEMTIIEINYAGALCVWHIEDEGYQERVFPTAALRVE